MRGLVLLCVVVLAALASAQKKEVCGRVFDGYEAGDSAVHVLGEPLSAHWSGFSPKRASKLDSILSYEWCAVSNSLVGDSAMNKRCSDSPFFTGHPDAAPWTSAGRSHRMLAADSDGKMKAGHMYHIVVRAVTGAGTMLYGISDGFVVREPRVEIEEEEHDDVHLSGRSIASHAVNNGEMHHHEKRDIAVPPTPINVGSDQIVTYNLLCPIDQENRCRQNQLKIGDYLTDVYGPPEWATELNPFREYYRFVSLDDDDDDDQTSSTGGYFGIGAVLGIAFGVAGIVLLAMLLVAALTSFNRRSDKFKTNVHRHDNYEEF